jgi:predicted site-specific integrase-resolvase
MGEHEPGDLTETEVAFRLRVNASTLRTWRRTGRGPAFVKYGRAVRYLSEDVEAFVQRWRSARGSVADGSALL